MSPVNVIAMIKSKVLPVTLLLYGIALLSSMAGMEILGWLTAALVLVVLVVERAKGIKSETVWFKFDWSLVALFVVVCLGALTVAPAPPVGSGAVQVIGSARFVFLFFLMRLALLWTYSETSWRRAVNILIGAATIIALYAVVQYFTGYEIIKRTHKVVTVWSTFANGQLYYRAPGLFDHPIRYAYSVAMSLCFPFALAIEQTKWKSVWTRYAVFACGLAMTFGVFASLTRGAWVAVAVAMLVLCCFQSWKKVLAIVGAAAVVSGLLAISRPELLMRAQSGSDAEKISNSIRIELWKVHFKMFEDSPIIGVGYGENETLVGTYLKKSGKAEDLVGGHAHNNYLQMLAGTGVLGFSCYMIFICGYLWLAFRLIRETPAHTWMRGFALAVLCVQIVMHVGGLTECNFKSAQLNHFFMFTLAALSVAFVKTSRRGVVSADR